MLEHNKENVIKLLEAMSNRTRSAATKEIKGSRLYNELILEASTYDSALDILKDADFFHEMCEIHGL